MAKIDDVVLKHRAAVLAGEKDLVERTVAIYKGLVKRLSTEAETLTAKYSNKPENPATAYRVERVQAFKAQATLELARWQTQLRSEVQAQQQLNLAQGMQLEADLFDAMGLAGGFNRMPTAALQAAAATLQEKSPVGKLLAGLAGEKVVSVTNTLQQQLALGRNPRETGKLIREDLGVGMARARTIARTETIRAYRIGQQAFLQENSDVVKGWWWNAHLGARTCGACLVLHGTFHTLEEILSDHPNGRCAMVPVLRDSSKFSSPAPPSWYSWFAGLSRAEQEKHFHPKIVELIVNKEIAWEKLIGKTYSPEWGSSFHVRPLKDFFNKDGSLKKVSQIVFMTRTPLGDTQVPVTKAKEVTATKRKPVEPPKPTPQPPPEDPMDMEYEEWQKRHSAAVRVKLSKYSTEEEKLAARAELRWLRKNKAYVAIYEGKPPPVEKPKKPKPADRIEKLLDELADSIPPKPITEEEIIKLFGDPYIHPVDLKKLGGFRGWLDAQPLAVRQKLLGGESVEALYLNGYISWDDLFEWNAKKGWSLKKWKPSEFGYDRTQVIQRTKRNRAMAQKDAIRKMIVEDAEHYQMTLRREYAEKYDLRNEWNGSLVLLDSKGLTYAGCFTPSDKPRSGFIGIVLEYTPKRSPARAVLVHEMLHGYSAKAREFGVGPLKLEEAIVETLTRRIEEKVAILSQIEQEFMVHLAYERYVQDLKKVLVDLENPTEYLIGLLKVGTKERWAMLQKRVSELRGQDRLEAIEALKRLEGAAG